MTPRSQETPKDRPSDRSRLVWYFIFLVYLAVLLFLIFDYTERDPALTDASRVNLVFFREIRRFWDALRGGYITWTAKLNLFGNIFLFVPFGFIVPLLTNRRLTGLKTALAAILTVGAIETYQYISQTGIFDVDDFILNWTGVLLGWLLFKAVQFIASHLRTKEH